jgi:hypothetical protein
MKKILICFLLPLIIFPISSCKKNKEGDDLVTGKWRLFEIESGLGGTIQVPSNENHIYTFGSDHRFSYTKNDTLIKSGTFTVFKEFIHLANTQGWFIKLSPENSEWVISRNGNELRLWQDVSDGAGLKFKRY